MRKMYFGREAALLNMENGYKKLGIENWELSKKKAYFCYENP